MTKNWYKPLIYAPKIEGVRKGIIRQTIRYHHPDSPMPVIDADRITLYTWEGRPYHSPWSWRGTWTVEDAIPARFYPGGDGVLTIHDTMVDEGMLDCLALFDGIYPPTGGELMKVLADVLGHRSRVLDDTEGYVPVMIWRW